MSVDNIKKMYENLYNARYNELLTSKNNELADVDIQENKSKKEKSRPHQYCRYTFHDGNNGILHVRSSRRCYASFGAILYIVVQARKYDKLICNSRNSPCAYKSLRSA